jgi:amino acid transporter
MTKSKYFLLFCLAFIFGVFLGSYVSIQIWILFLLAGFCISLVFLLKINKINRPPDKGGWGVDSASYNKRLPIIILILIVFLLSGFIRMESGKLSGKDIFEIENLSGQKLSLEGDVSEMPEII